jgi:hypothetical protein
MYWLWIYFLKLMEELDIASSFFFLVKLLLVITMMFVVV